MAFQFTLATVLRLKRSIEKQEELALQKILVQISQVRHEADTLTADIARARQSLDKAMQQPLPAVQVESMIDQINDAIRRKQALLDSLAELHRQREMQTRKYQASHNSRKMLSDMEARQRDAYVQERVRAEQKFLDEIFASRAQRR